MASQAFTTRPLAGSALRSVRTGPAQQQRNVAAAGVSKKINTLDENWKKVSSIICNLLIVKTFGASRAMLTSCKGVHAGQMCGLSRDDPNTGGQRRMHAAVEAT